MKKKTNNRIEIKTKDILFSKKDQEVFFKEILNPSKPNFKLKEAFERYKNKLE